MQAKCPECSRDLNFPDSMAGATARCPYCGGPVDVPIAAAESRAEPETSRSEPAGPGMKRCPACGEEINATARKCRYCGEFLIQCPRCGAETAKGFPQCHACSGTLAASASPPARGQDASPPAPYRSRSRQRGEDDRREVADGIQRATEIAGGIRQAIASTQSFVGPAFLAWLLYYIGFYFIGLIVNFTYLSHASRIERETGVRPHGKGCLTLLLVVHFWLPLIAIVILGVVLVVGVVMGGIDLRDWLERVKRR